MNELEKALEQLNIKYETNGKQYKIPTTRENLVELLKGYIAMTINLQSKIDKAIDWIEQYEKQIGTLGETSKSIVLTDDVVIGNLLDILKEDK
jgi:hypothetical protein